MSIMVHHVIAGGEAVISYGYPRLTGEIDLFYERTRENIDKLWEALILFWEGDIPLIERKEALWEEGVIVQFGVPPNQIDLINRIDGVSFEEAWPSKTIGTIQTDAEIVPISSIGLGALIQNKTCVMRPKDQEDLIYREAFRKGKKNDRV